MGITTRWINVYVGGTRDVVAQWLLDNPYTGPASAHDETDEWVHYPNGALKIRRVDSVPTLSSELMGIGSKYVDDVTPNVLFKYGVRYTVPVAVFRDPETLQQYVAERVAEFVANRDAYYMTDGQYPQGN